MIMLYAVLAAICLIALLARSKLVQVTLLLLVACLFLGETGTQISNQLFASSGCSVNLLKGGTRCVADATPVPWHLVLGKASLWLLIAPFLILTAVWWILLPFLAWAEFAARRGAPVHKV